MARLGRTGGDIGDGALVLVMGRCAGKSGARTRSAGRGRRPTSFSWIELKPVQVGKRASSQYHCTTEASTSEVGVSAFNSKQLQRSGRHRPGQTEHRGWSSGRAPPSFVRSEPWSPADSRKGPWLAALDDSCRRRLAPCRRASVVAFDAVDLVGLKQPIGRALVPIGLAIGRGVPGGPSASTCALQSPRAGRLMRCTGYSPAPPPWAPPLRPATAKGAPEAAAENPPGTGHMAVRGQRQRCSLGKDRLPRQTRRRPHSRYRHRRAEGLRSSRGINPACFPNNSRRLGRSRSGG